MKTAFILFAGILINCNLFAQTPEKKLYDKDFKWSITIPEGFESVSNEEWRKIQNRGAEAIEDTYNAKITERPAMVFVFKNNQFNYIEANRQPFDPQKDGNYAKSNQATREIIYNTFKAQMAGATLDSTSSTEMIGGLQFSAFHIDVTLPNNRIMQMSLYSRLFGKKDLTVGMVTIEAEKRKILLEALKQSTFDK